MPTVTLSEADAGRTVRARLGDEIVVRLPENATTGYRWHVGRAEGIAAIEERPGEGVVEAESDVQIGQGGLREFRFRVEGRGIGRLELMHTREWEGESTALGRFAIDIAAG
jgi:predicted secreted protein